MVKNFINKTVARTLKDQLGLINGRDKVVENIELLISHPVLNTRFFTEKDKEIILNKLETVEVLISNEDDNYNNNNFFSLLGTHTKYLLDDFNALYKLKDNTETSYVFVNKKNKISAPRLNSIKVRVPVGQHQHVLIKRIEFSLTSLIDVATQFNNLYQAVNKTIPPYLESLMTRVDDELTRYRRLRNIADNARTENIYDNAVVKYRKLEAGYRLYFYCSLAIVLSLTIGLFLFKHFYPSVLSMIEFWAIKISFLLVGITLISYFLKQSSHYQRLADQNYQTQVELQAYPSFMESIPTDEAASVRKELALKYFGREIDGAAHKDISNLISDQMKSTTEMVKATTEAIKNLKG
ncbi:hypothetical protein [Acinetobacter oleivorans]|uniref:hypothetical protein n=1 Tax=Acinetobacter oleivorans TaxID=1148157 RepID=UPI003A8C25FE